MVTRFEHTIQCNKVNVEHLLQLGVKFRSGDPIILQVSPFDVSPFLYDNAKLLALEPSNMELHNIVSKKMYTNSKYQWAFDPAEGLSWPETTWCSRLFQSILHDIPKSVTVVTSYLWQPGELSMSICSIFPMLDPSIINIAPFRGMPDFLFIGQKVAAVMIEDTVENFIVQNSYACVEIGLNKTSCTCADGIYLPDKVGELIANMHYYGSLLCLQKLKECDHVAEKVTFIAQGYYISKSTGTIILQLKVAEDGITVEIKSINYSQREIPGELWFLIKSIMD